MTMRLDIIYLVLRMFSVTDQMILYPRLSPSTFMQ